MTDSASMSTPTAGALRPLALLAVGHTGADIERLVREARARARRERRPMTWADIEQGITGISPPTNPKLDWQIAVHEIGHAIAYCVFGLGHVETVRIGGRGGEVSVSAEIGELQDDDGLTRLMACLLAGRTAELIVFGTPMVGAGGSRDSDLGKATQLALDAETSLGLGGEMPLLFRPPTNPGDMLHYDQSVARRVNDRLLTAETMVHGCLEDRRDILTELASRLQMVRVLEGDQVRDALAQSIIARRL